MSIIQNIEPCELCEFCKTFFDEKKLVWVNGGNKRCCADCLKEQIKTCEQCGEQWDEDDFVFIPTSDSYEVCGSLERDGDSVCPECAGAL